MPLNPVILGAQVIVDLGVSDPVVSALLIAMQVPLCVWTASHIKVDPTANVPLIATGAVVAGAGGFTYSGVSSLTSTIASALSLTDPKGVEKLGIVTQHYADTIKNFGIVLPTSLVGYAGTPPPPAGAVTGTGKLLLNGNFTFYTALGLTDAQSIATWTAYGDSLKTHLELFAEVSPGSMVNPAAGGPLTGTGDVA